MKHRLSRLSALVACSLLAAGPVLTDELLTMEEAMKHLTGIQRNVTNANMRVRHGGPSGMSAASEVEEKQQTLAEKCCGNNIKRINEKVQLLTKTFSQWDRYFAERDNAEALETLQLMRDQLNEVAIGAAQFRMAVSRARAIQALQGLVPPYLALVRTTDDLAACCPLPESSETEPAKKKRKP